MNSSRFWWGRGLTCPYWSCPHSLKSSGPSPSWICTGADNQILDSSVPIRQILEQLVSKTGIPPFMLGLSWSSTERMSTQQADLLTTEMTAIRRLGLLQQILKVDIVPDHPEAASVPVHPQPQRDFVAVGDVDIKVIGADNQILDSSVPIRQILEQLVSKTGRLLGLSSGCAFCRVIFQCQLPGLLPVPGRLGLLTR